MTSPHDDLAAYVVDALEPSERAAFEAHLATCDACSQEVAQLTETATELSSLHAAAPPPALRDSILRAITQVPQLPAGSPGATAPGDRQPRTVPSEAPGFTYREQTVPPALPPGAFGATTPRERQTPMSSAGAGNLPSRELGQATERIPGSTAIGPRNRAGWVVAAALAMVVGLSGWLYATSQRRAAEAAADQLAAQQQAAAAQRQAQAALLSAEDLRTYPTRTPDGRQVAFLVSRRQNEAMFISPDLPSPGPGKQYQLWTIHSADDVRPDVVFDGGGTTSAFFSGPVAEAAQLAVTIEPAGGSTTPTLPIQAAASL